jgi:hypothetical protein
MDWLIALWALFVQYWPEAAFSLVLPYIVALIIRCDWSKAAKMWTSVAVSLVYGILGSRVAGITLTPEHLGVFVASAFTISSLAYAQFVKNGLTNGWLTSLQNIGSQ